jgi:peptidoglycan/xylan/chitin deacetylase (PgdA/CDA1 family)
MTEVLVLCYHGVSETWHTSMAVTPEALERQLAHMVKHGWQSAAFGDAVMDPPADRTMAITFDDALASVRQFALPILGDLGLTATVFVPTDHASSGRPCTWEGLEDWIATPYADELCPMSWEEIGELADSGWEIGSHTRSHPHLTRLADDALASELELSREESIRELGVPCRTIAYPYGDVDARVVEFTRRAGYYAGAACSSEAREPDRYRWPRTGVYNRDALWRFVLKTTPAVTHARRSRAWPARAFHRPAVR